MPDFDVAVRFKGGLCRRIYNAKNEDEAQKQVTDELLQYVESIGQLTVMAKKVEEEPHPFFLSLNDLNKKPPYECDINILEYDEKEWCKKWEGMFEKDKDKIEFDMSWLFASQGLNIKNNDVKKEVLYALFEANQTPEKRKHILELLVEACDIAKQNNIELADDGLDDEDFGSRKIIID